MSFIITLVLAICIIWLAVYVIDILAWIGFAVIAFIAVYAIIHSIKKSNRDY